MSSTLPPVAYSCSPGTCDGCSKKRRTLYGVGRDYDGDYAIALCFFCVKQGERDYYRDLQREYEEGSRPEPYEPHTWTVRVDG